MHPGYRIAIFVFATLGAIAARAYGQDEDEAENAGAVQVVKIVFTDQQFDQMAFGTKRSAAAARQQFEAQLAAEIRSLEQVCSLSEAQCNKLRLAGSGDITRWLRSVEEIREKYQASRMDRQAYTEAALALQPLRYLIEYGFAATNSMFRKTLRATLTEQQLPTYQQLMRERQKATIDQALLLVERDKTVRLTDDHRQKLTALLLEHTNPPTYTNPYAPYIVLVQAKKIEGQIRQLLDDSEWLKFSTAMSTAQRVEPTLRRAGLIDDADSAGEELTIREGRKSRE